jgi:hypothetical protein
MSLIINKELDNLFSLTFDGGEPIKSEQNRLTTIGNLCNFKSGNGANLILKQNILVTDITLISDGTFTFTNTNDLFEKLFQVGFFGIATGGGSTIDRFDELTDTFDYFGRDGQVVVVNESQQRLETQSISVFSAEDKAKLDGIETGADVNVQADFNENNPNSDAFIRNKPNLNALFSGIYINRFIADGTTNEFTLPIGAIILNVNVDRGFIREWTQVDNILTITLDLLPSGADVDVSGLTI